MDKGREPCFGSDGDSQRESLDLKAEGPECICCGKIDEPIVLCSPPLLIHYLVHMREKIELLFVDEEVV